MIFSSRARGYRVSDGAFSIDNGVMYKLMYCSLQKVLQWLNPVRLIVRRLPPSRTTIHCSSWRAGQLEHAFSFQVSTAFRRVCSPTQPHGVLDFHKQDISQSSAKVASPPAFVPLLRLLPAKELTILNSKTRRGERTYRTKGPRMRP
jgi:hypothetical protein